MNKNNLSIVRQQFAQCVFIHKVLEKAGDRMEKINTKTKLANVIILAFVLIFLVLQARFLKYTFLNDMAIGITVFEILVYLHPKRDLLQE